MSRGKTLKNTFGWARIKVLGLLVNMLFLGALCFAVSVEAVQTMVHASHENTEPRYPWLIIILGVADFAVNIICFLLIGGNHTAQLTFCALNETSCFKGLPPLYTDEIC